MARTDKKLSIVFNGGTFWWSDSLYEDTDRSEANQRGETNQFATYTIFF